MKAANSKLSNYYLWIAREIADNAAVSYAISQAAQFLLSLLTLHVQCVQCVCVPDSAEAMNMIMWSGFSIQPAKKFDHIIIFICTA